MSYSNPVDQPVLTIGNTAYPFIQNIQNLLNSNPPPAILFSSTAAYNGMLAEGSAAQVNTFFNNFVLAAGSPPAPASLNAPYVLPQNWDQFITQFRALTGTANPSTTGGTVFDAFVSTYKKFMNISTTNPNATPDGDFAVLAGQGVTAADLKAQFVNSFNHFLQTYSFPNNSSYSFGTPQQFFDNYIKYMTQTAVLQTTTGSATGSAPGLPAFEQIWTSYGFPVSSFPAALKKFYDGILLQTGNGHPENGYFTPSQVLNTWMDSVKNQYLSTMLVSSVSTTGGDEVLVIDRILRLLVQLIGILQNISSSQADRLGFLTRWQVAYTHLLTDIPTFTQGDKSAIDSNVPTIPTISPKDTAKSEATVRDQVNPKMQSLQDKTRARRDSISDQAKAMQSIINQSQTSANAQSAFLSQLDTLLAAIYK
jgi:hypothetical protein